MKVENRQKLNPQGSNTLSPAAQFENWLFEQGGACLWEREVSSAQPFKLSCFGLNGRIFIMQIWPEGGTQVYAAVGDPTIEGTIAEMNLLAKGAEPTLAGLIDAQISALAHKTAAPGQATWNSAIEAARHSLAEFFLRTRYTRRP